MRLSSTVLFVGSNETINTTFLGVNKRCFRERYDNFIWSSRVSIYSSLMFQVEEAVAVLQVHSTGKTGDI